MMTEECIEQLPSVVIKSRLLALEKAKIDLQQQLKNVEKQIAQHEGILHRRELDQYGEELKIMRQLKESWNGDKVLFNEMLAETHRIPTGVVYLFKGLDLVFMEIQETEHIGFVSKYPPELAKRLRTRNNTLIVLFDL